MTTYLVIALVHSISAIVMIIKKHWIDFKDVADSYGIEVGSVDPGFGSHIFQDCV